MDFSRTLLLLMLTGALLLSSALTQAAGPTLWSLSQAGQQRVLVERMSKSWFQLKTHIKPDQARKALPVFVAKFSSQLLVLEHRYPKGKIGRSLVRVRKHWRAYRLIIEGEQTLDNAEALLEQDEALARATRKVALLIEDALQGSLAGFIKLSERQRMLSQRLVKLYLIQFACIGGGETEAKLQRARSEYTGVLKKLIESPEINEQSQPLIRRLLTKSRLFEIGLDKNKDNMIPLIVAMTGDQVLSVLDKLLLKYRDFSVPS